MHALLTFLILWSLSGIAPASPYIGVHLKKSFPEQFGLVSVSRTLAGAPFQSPLAAFNNRTEISLMVRLDGQTALQGLMAAGFTPRGLLYESGVVTTGLKIEPGRLSELYKLRGMLSIMPSSAAKHSASPMYGPALAKPLLDQASDLLGARAFHDRDIKGQNVLVGMFDSGIEWANPDFRNADGTSRILWLWDMALNARAGEHTPPYPGTQFGVEYTRAQINAEIQGNTSGFIRHGGDKILHGTLTTGAAASSGLKANAVSPVGAFPGIAPMASIIFVSGEDSTGGFPEENILASLDYFTAKADSLGLPLVMNYSIGDKLTARDGSSPDEKKIDQVMVSGTLGRLIVIASGNNGNGSPSVRKFFALYESDYEVPFIITDYQENTGVQNDVLIFSFWYQGAGNLAIDIFGPVTSTVTPAKIFTMGADDTIVSHPSRACGMIQAAKEIDPSNGLLHIVLAIYDDKVVRDLKPKPGAWKFVFRRTDNTGTALLDGWRINDLICGSHAIYAQIPGANDSFTVSSPCCARNSLCVGNYISRTQWKNYQGINAHFQQDTTFNCVSLGKLDEPGYLDFNSSRGPTRDGRQKPDLTAPGCRVMVTRPMGVELDPIFILEDSIHFASGGSSISSPLVAGAAALLLQLKPDWDSQDLKNLLTSMAKSDAFTGSPPSYEWGSGKAFLDYNRVMEYLSAVQPKDRSVPSTTLEFRPNPADSYLEVSWNPAWFFTAGNPVTFRLYDISGKMVYSKQLVPEARSAGLMKLRLKETIRDLASGLYMCVIQAENGRMVRKPLLVVH